MIDYKYIIKIIKGPKLVKCELVSKIKNLKNDFDFFYGSVITGMV